MQIVMLDVRKFVEARHVSKEMLWKIFLGISVGIYFFEATDTFLSRFGHRSLDMPWFCPFWVCSMLGYRRVFVGKAWCTVG